jgi:hypothetical protein
MAEVFKTALNMGLIHFPSHELLELELRFLQKTGVERVDHPSVGPVQSKDVADAVMNVVWHLVGRDVSKYLHDDLSRSPHLLESPVPKQRESASVFGQLAGYAGSRGGAGSPGAGRTSTRVPGRGPGQGGARRS